MRIWVWLFVISVFTCKQERGTGYTSIFGIFLCSFWVLELTQTGLAAIHLVAAWVPLQLKSVKAAQVQLKFLGALFRLVELLCGHDYR